MEDINSNYFLFFANTQKWACRRQSYIYIYICQHLLCSTHHHTDLTEASDRKKKESVLLFQRKPFVIRLWKLHRSEHSLGKYSRTLITQLSAWGNYPMTFVQAGFCCDAYQKNTTVVVVIIKRNLALFIQFRDSFSHPMNWMLSSIYLN